MRETVIIFIFFIVIRVISTTALEFLLYIYFRCIDGSVDCKNETGL